MMSGFPRLFLFLVVALLVRGGAGETTDGDPGECDGIDCGLLLCPVAACPAGGGDVFGCTGRPHVLPDGSCTCYKPESSCSPRPGDRCDDLPPGVDCSQLDCPVYQCPETAAAAAAATTTKTGNDADGDDSSYYYGCVGEAYVQEDGSCRCYKPESSCPTSPPTSPPPHQVGDVCGTPPTDCPPLKCPCVLCDSTGEPAHGCCGDCYLQEDGSSCFGIKPQSSGVPPSCFVNQPSPAPAADGTEGEQQPACKRWRQDCQADNSGNGACCSGTSCGGGGRSGKCRLLLPSLGVLDAILDLLGL
jgi:hypothetical protein